MDHKDFLRQLPAHDRTRLTTTKNVPALAHLGLYVLALSISTTWIMNTLPGWPVLLLPQGILLVFLFTLMHETSHLTAFRSATLNKVICAGCGFVLAIPPVWFRFFHLAHHKYTQDPERDPELATAKPNSRMAYALHVSGLHLWISLATTLASNALGRDPGSYVPALRMRAVRAEACLMLGLYAGLGAISLWAQSSVLLWVWLIPMVIGQPFLRLFLLAEHGHCPHVSDMFENSRTTYTARLIHFVSWNMPYHAEHHAYPMVPYHQLPKLHQLCREHLKTTAKGYAQFNRDYIAALPVDPD